VKGGRGNIIRLKLKYLSLILAVFLCAAAPGKINPSKGPGNRKADYGEVQSLIRKSLNREIANENPGEIELFFLGVALYGKQDVFMRETLYAQEIFEERYAEAYGGSRASHSLSLINNKKTSKRHLFANKDNLSEILSFLGEKMGDEDILFIYFTSHGSRDHKLSLILPSQFRSGLDSKEIRSMLDDADIPWRVLVVSACFSGGFIPELEAPNSIVATAADADHSSFGCTDTRNFTYYGEALFKRQMKEGMDLVDALNGIPPIIIEMEAEQGYEHSNPQLSIGEDFLKHWEKYKADLAARLEERTQVSTKPKPKKRW